MQAQADREAAGARAREQVAVEFAALLRAEERPDVLVGAFRSYDGPLCDVEAVRHAWTRIVRAGALEARHEVAGLTDAPRLMRRTWNAELDHVPRAAAVQVRNVPDWRDGTPVASTYYLTENRLWKAWSTLGDRVALTLKLWLSARELGRQLSEKDERKLMSQSEYRWWLALETGTTAEATWNKRQHRVEAVAGETLMHVRADGERNPVDKREEILDSWRAGRAADPVAASDVAKTWLRAVCGACDNPVARERGWL